MKTTLTTQDKIRLVNDWVSTYNAITLQYQELSKIVGCMIEAPLFHALYIGFDRYTDALAMLIGDEGEWLAWYCFENEMGKKGMAAGKSGHMKPIKTTKDLVKLIEA